VVALAFPDPRFETVGKVRRRLDRRQISKDQQGPSDFCVVRRAALALGHMPLHANQLDPRQGIVYVRNVLLTKLAAIHGDRLRVR
jgi:hypothetical protein